jgi:hypothetical protein
MRSSRDIAKVTSATLAVIVVGTTGAGGNSYIKNFLLHVFPACERPVRKGFKKIFFPMCFSLAGDQ